MPALTPSSLVKTAFIHSSIHSLSNQIPVEHLPRVRHSIRLPSDLTFILGETDKTKSEQIIKNCDKINAKGAKKVNNGKET